MEAMTQLVVGRVTTTLWSTSYASILFQSGYARDFKGEGLDAEAPCSLQRLLVDPPNMLRVVHIQRMACMALLPQNGRGVRDAVLRPCGMGNESAERRLHGGRGSEETRETVEAGRLLEWREGGTDTRGTMS